MGSGSLPEIRGQCLLQVQGIERGSVKAHCPRCNGQRSCDVHGSYDDDWSWEDDGGHYQYGKNKHRLLRCRGCETVFYHLAASCSEDWEGRFNTLTGEEEIFLPERISTFPSPEASSVKPDWVWDLHRTDSDLASVVSELYDAYEAGLFVLTAIGLRSAFDRGSEVLGVNADATFKDKIEALVKQGHVGRREAESLQILVEAGNAAAHRAWRPTPEALRSLLNLLEHFLHRSFFAQTDLDVPRRQRRSKVD